MTHTLQWHQLGSTVQQRDANWAARGAVDAQRGESGLRPVAVNPDGTETTIGSLIGGDPKRLDVLDSRFTLQGVAHWVERGYVLPHNQTFSLP
jgi:hypothetical protein